jgi:hypothetical protein
MTIGVVDSTVINSIECRYMSEVMSIFAEIAPHCPTDLIRDKLSYEVTREMWLRSELALASLPGLARLSTYLPF